MRRFLRLPEFLKSRRRRERERVLREINVRALAQSRAYYDAGAGDCPVLVITKHEAAAIYDGNIPMIGDGSVGVYVTPFHQMDVQVGAT